MRKILFSIVALFVTVVVIAQSSYNFTASNQPYSNLVNPTSLSNGEVWDDPLYAIPLEFNFTISTHTFNVIYVVDWSVGGALASSPSSVAISPLFVPIGQDIVSLEDTGGNSLSPISYKIEGAPGSRIVKIEWQNFGFFGDTTLNDFMNMQLWLYEDGNIIEYRYGPNAINNLDESFEGEAGPLVGLLTSSDIDNGDLLDVAYVLTENTTNPTVETYLPGSTINPGSLLGAIPNGTVYRFEPTILSVSENFKNVFSVSPNPATDVLTIHTTLEDFSIALYDALGKQLEIEKIDAKTIPVSHLPAGIYLLKIQTDMGSQIKKIIKQ